jgi:hypothetical protein
MPRHDDMRPIYCAPLTDGLIQHNRPIADIRGIFAMVKHLFPKAEISQRGMSIKMRLLTSLD